MGTLLIHYYDAKGQQQQASYNGLTQAQTATKIAAAFVAGSVLRIEFRH